MTGTFRIVSADPVGRSLAFVTRKCCGPDGEGPCLAREEGLPCGVGEVPTYAPASMPPERSERFRRIRRDLGLTLGEAAARLGVSVTDVSAVETGRAEVEGWEALLARLTSRPPHEHAAHEQAVLVEEHRGAVYDEQREAQGGPGGDEVG